MGNYLSRVASTVLITVALIGSLIGFAHAQSKKPIDDPLRQYKTFSREFNQCINKTTNARSVDVRAECYEAELRRINLGLQKVIAIIKEDVIDMDPSGKADLYYADLYKATPAYINAMCDFGWISAMTELDGVDLRGSCRLTAWMNTIKMLDRQRRIMTADDLIPGE